LILLIRFRDDKLTLPSRVLKLFPFKLIKLTPLIRAFPPPRLYPREFKSKLNKLIAAEYSGIFLEKSNLKSLFNSNILLFILRVLKT
tara:strand:+ start:410 stop:670 length:261 start_codon:yes stop_codon:yes gene_type:complete